MAQGADVHAQARGRFFQPKDEGGYFYFGEYRWLRVEIRERWCLQPSWLPHTQSWAASGSRSLRLCLRVGALKKAQKGPGFRFSSCFILVT